MLSPLRCHLGRRRGKEPAESSPVVDVACFSPSFPVAARKGKKQREVSGVGFGEGTNGGEVKARGASGEVNNSQDGRIGRQCRPRPAMSQPSKEMGRYGPQ